MPASWSLDVFSRYYNPIPQISPIMNRKVMRNSDKSVIIIIIHRFFFVYLLFSECNCNEFSHRCFFDKELYDRTGHGGHCLDCAGNRDGANCERCRENYYQKKGDTHCSPCECNEIGECRVRRPMDVFLYVPIWFSRTV